MHPAEVQSQRRQLVHTRPQAQQTALAQGVVLTHDCMHTNLEGWVMSFGMGAALSELNVESREAFYCRQCRQLMKVTLRYG